MSESLDFLTAEEIAWISQSLPQPKENQGESPPKKKPRGSFVDLGEMVVQAASLVKGFQRIGVGDELELVINAKHSLLLGRSQKKSVLRYVRLRHVQSEVEIGKISNEIAQFIITLADLGLARFKARILYLPERALKLLDDIFVTLSIELASDAFGSSLDQDDVSPECIRKRKEALANLFERCGLIDSSKALLCRQATDLLQEASQEVSEADISRIYGKSSKMIGQNVKPLQPASGMSVVLRDYQKVALGFMYSKEARNLVSSGLSPLWTEIKTQSQDTIYFNPYSGELALALPKEHHTLGGILADEMGLGKTIEILALVHTNPFSHSDQSALLKRASPATLIVCPLNLISQWKDEAERCFGDSGTADIYYGGDRKRGFTNEKTPRIIITTYGTLVSDYAQGEEKSGLYSCHWHRVVLDEAHYIKEKVRAWLFMLQSTKAAKACFALHATNRWAVTGTPIVNKLDDLYSIVKFLRVDPWASFGFW
ncbi:DNA helicase rad5 [Kappamyces sp. JEL0680]|nr:DNA helicase rad5 [Kappamyces sp. JEL0680]